MNYLDFAKGYKTIAGAIVLVMSILGHSISSEDTLAAITGIGETVGLVITTYGLVMKVVRNLK